MGEPLECVAVLASSDTWQAFLLVFVISAPTATTFLSKLTLQHRLVQLEWEASPVVVSVSITKITAPETTGLGRDHTVEAVTVIP